MEAQEAIDLARKCLEEAKDAMARNDEALAQTQNAIEIAAKWMERALMAEAALAQSNAALDMPNAGYGSKENE